MEANAALIASVSSIVKQRLAGLDASHDWHHIARVHALAKSLAAKEGLTEPRRLLVVELAALLHDIADWKYHGGDDTANERAIVEVLEAEGADAALVSEVVAVVKAVSYHSELAGGAAAAPPLEAAIVQDADRLDAIGAVGIARTFAFSGAKGRAMYCDDDLNVGYCTAMLGRTLTKEEYGAANSTTVGHFYAKLLRLKGMLKTAAGRALGEARHAVMVDFLDQMRAEVAGEK